MEAVADYIPYPAAPYSSRRQPVYAANGVVATSQPLAAQAGLAVLQRGGNAVDAAVATAVTLTVVEPASCGMGGDAFALVWDGTKLHGLNGSGRAPARLTAETVIRQGYDEMPSKGWLPVTVPGAPAAWRDLHQRFGRLPFAELFETAVHYAEAGYPISPISQYNWTWAEIKMRQALTADEFAHWAAVFMPEGRPPRVGELWRSPAMSRSLRRIAETDADAFYRGELAQTIVDFAAQTGGFLRADDLAQHRSTWVEPIHTNYRGYDVWEIPPNGQGLAALITLNILEGFDLANTPRESVQSYHWQLEAMKLAFADAQQYIADPERAEVPTAALLSKAYAAERRRLIDDEAGLPPVGEPGRGDTAYLCVVDGEGMMVSLIESTFSSFGSGIVVPGTGIALQNRGSGFSLAVGHRNRLEGGKRPYHTIIPGFLTKDGQPVGPFGVMGGHMQPQGHVQMMLNTIDYGLNPQASLDATRWYWGAGRAIKVEPATDPEIVAGLRERGHEVEIDADVDVFGNGQVVWRLESGAYVAGSDGRTDGCAIGF
ncbi:MAG: gamma-glutamyltransferase [Ardenticatenaceae bacterium]|nr:gamma-glutamyltransferase [Ardenticatenaceae bacterium]MCB9445416.1 gamma-glutamyltransferase [Ardenticatenaceae bacterium]